MIVHGWQLLGGCPSLTSCPKANCKAALEEASSYALCCKFQATIGITDY